MVGRYGGRVTSRKPQRRRTRVAEAPASGRGARPQQRRNRMRALGRAGGGRRDRGRRSRWWRRAAATIRQRDQVRDRQRSPSRARRCPVLRLGPRRAPDPAIGKTIPTLDGSVGLRRRAGHGRGPTASRRWWCSSRTGARTARPRCRGSSRWRRHGVFDGVDVTAVATGTDAAAPNYPPSAWLKREHWPFPVMADSTRSTAANAYGLSAYPVLRAGGRRRQGRRTRHRRGPARPDHGQRQGVEGRQAAARCCRRARARALTASGRAPQLQAGADADEVEAVVLGAEAGRAGDGGGGRRHRAFEPRRRGHVLDASARRADEVVVVTGEVFGELPARELVGADDAVHDARLLEHDEVAVHGALREARDGRRGSRGS